MDWTAFLFFSPMAIMGLLLIVYAPTIKEMVEASRRYARSSKYSVGAYRTMGAGIIVAALVLAWYMAQPLSTHEPKPFPSTQSASQ